MSEWKKITQNLNFLKEINGLRKYVNVMTVVSCNRREQKLLNFKVIESDKDYINKFPPVTNIAGIPWLNINIFDIEIVDTLKKAEAEGTLIDETNQAPKQEKN